MTGATMIPHPVFDVPSVMARIPEENISMLPGPPAIYQTILNHPELDSFDMSHLRLAVTGAAPVPVEMIKQMRNRLGFETILTGYGLTEASGIATMCRHDDDPEVISRTSGRAIDGVEVLVVDGEGNEVPRGEPGEIVIRGYNVMQGYLDDPDKTAETVDSDGWLHTGDVGVMDDAGYIDITDRLKDLFINGGFNAYPAEIEALMLPHPAIGQVAVVGAPGCPPWRGGLCVRGRRARCRTVRRGDHRVVPRADGQLQGAALRRVRGCTTPECQRQGVEVRASRAGGRDIGREHLAHDSRRSTNSRREGPGAGSGLAPAEMRWITAGSSSTSLSGLISIAISITGSQQVRIGRDTSRNRLVPRVPVVVMVIGPAVDLS